MKKFKAIFSDIDGTLVSFTTHRVPESTFKAIEQARSQGVKVIIATGRPFGDFDIIGDVPYDAVISLNGSDCRWKDGPVIRRHFIDYDEFKKMSELSDEYGFALCLELSEGFFINRITPPVLDVANTLNHSVPVPADIEEVFRTYGCGQLSAYFDAETERKVMSQVPGLCASRWHSGFVNIDVAGIDKGTALKEMAGLMGIGIDETISFGDGGNDIPLIKAAGLGVAMGNAGEELKAVAGYVTASVDEDGFAAALQRFVL